MKNILTTILIIISLLMLNVRAGVCQETGTTAKQPTAEEASKQQQQGQGTGAKQAPRTPVRLDDSAKKVKRMVEKIGVAGRLTLFLRNGETLHGSVVSYDDETVQVAEIDLKQVLTLHYRNIKKIREDYGKRDLITGQRSNPPKGVKLGISAGLLFVAIGLPLIVLASMKD